jgi:hypothetical protein
MKKIRGRFNKMNNFIKGDDVSKIHSDEKPLYEFSKEVLENQFVAKVYPNQNGALIKMIVNETVRIINIEKNESFQLKFGLIGTKLEIENFISNNSNVSFDFSIKAVVGVGFLSKKINLFKKEIVMKKTE